MLSQCRSPQLFIAVSEKEITRETALGMIADYVGANVPAFDLSIVGC
jgi:hypothetical protein